MKVSPIKVVAAYSIFFLFFCRKFAGFQSLFWITLTLELAKEICKQTHVGIEIRKEREKISAAFKQLKGDAF